MSETTIDLIGAEIDQGIGIFVDISGGIKGIIIIHSKIYNIQQNLMKI